MRVRFDGAAVRFRCPGCGDEHRIPVLPANPGWQWNGSVDRPTLGPSISVKTGHHASAWSPGEPCWCTKDYGYTCFVCHSVVADGRIAFEADSTHDLSGKTVDLFDIVEDAP